MFAHGLILHTHSHACGATVGMGCSDVDDMIWKIATIDFDELATAAAPFFFCCLLAALWVLLCFLCCGKLLPDYWVERAVMEVGLSLGATATALLVVSKHELSHTCALCYIFH